MAHPAAADGTMIAFCTSRLMRLVVILSVIGGHLPAQVAPIQESGDSISIRIIDSDLRSAVQALGPYLDLPVLFTGSPGGPITIETPRPIPRQDVLRLLTGLIESQQYQIVTDTAARMYRVMPRPPPQPARPTAPADISSRQDRPANAVDLFVIPLQHARAPDVASTINALYGRGGTVSDPVSQLPTLGGELRSNRVPAVGGANEASRIPNDSRARGTLSGDISIVADQRANSLLVRANAADMTLVRAVVEALDVRPLQVLIEVVIAEVRRDRSLGISVEGELGPTTVGKSGAVIDGVFGDAGLGDFALHVMGLGGLDLESTLRLASARGNVRILTRPVVLATNNQLAEIVVGSQRPFIQVQRALPTDAAARDQVVQYKDVGTKLTVRPTISLDGSVQLEVTQEVSTATSELAFNAPVISTRSVQTQLLVRDGQTVALGGLTDRQTETRRSGLPVLSAIPILGGLFGRSTKQTVETELFVFLTPRVLRTDDDAERASEPLRDRAGVRP